MLVTNATNAKKKPDPSPSTPWAVVETNYDTKTIQVTMGSVSTQYKTKTFVTYKKMSGHPGKTNSFSPCKLK